MLVKTFLEKEATAFERSKARDLIPLRFAIAEINPTAATHLSEEEAARLKAEFGTDFNITKQAGKVVNISVPGEAGAKFRQAMTGLTKVTSHQTLLYKNSLISLVSSAEWFLSQIVTQYLSSFPEAVGLSDKKLTLQELKRIGSVQEAEAYLISLRVDEIMWGSLEDWLKFFKDVAGLSMGYLLEEKSSLVELFQRRNVMVHNNGKVHHSYIAEVDGKLREDVKLGDDLNITLSYLEGAISTVERNFLLIACELWKKLAPKDEKRGLILNKVAIDSIINERYSIAEAASYFQMGDKQLPEQWQIYAQLNYWQTKKWTEQFESVRADVHTADFSAKDDISKLGRLVLLDEIESSIHLLRELLRAGKLTTKDVDEWPIFKEFRVQLPVKKLLKTFRAKENASVRYTTKELSISDEDGAVTSPSKEPIN